MTDVWVQRTGEEPFAINDSGDMGKRTLADALKNGAKVVNKEKDDAGSVVFETVPDDDWSVKEIRKWMAGEKIKYGSRDKKATLLEKVKDAIS